MRFIMFFIMKGFIISDYGGWQAPRSVAGNLETQKSEWYHFSLSSKAWEPRETMVQVSLWIQRKKTYIPAQRHSIRKSEFSITQPLCSVEPFDELDEVHPHRGEQSSLFQSTDSNVDFIQKHLHRHTQNSI